jgi:Outer membrane lipoprotein
MKKLSLLCVMLILVGCLGAVPTFAQSAAKTGPDSSVLRDPELEKDSLHNLDVARQYFKLKKAYLASLKRCEEIIAGNPNFAKIDEVLYIAGASSMLLAEGRGKQQPGSPVEKLRSDAKDYLTHLVDGYPESAFRKQAEEALRRLGNGNSAQKN